MNPGIGWSIAVGWGVILGWIFAGLIVGAVIVVLVVLGVGLSALNPRPSLLAGSCQAKKGKRKVIYDPLGLASLHLDRKG